jgi:V/A-type H+-transporting ATPase subunit C
MPRNIFVGTAAAAVKGTLLEKGPIEKLAESTTLDELVNRLKGTPYAEYLIKVTQPYTALALELAFRERLADVHFRMMNLTGNYELVSSYYLRQIAWDLKSVLKSKALGRSSEESMEYLTLHAEELVGRRDLIVRIVSARDIQEVPSLLAGTEFGKDVSDAVSIFMAKREIRTFDLFIDHAVMSGIAKAYSTRAGEYKSSRAVDVAGIREMVALDINSFNVLSVLRAKLWKLPEEETRSLVLNPIAGGGFVNVQSMVSVDSISEAIKLVPGSIHDPIQTAGTDEESIDLIESYLVGESSRVARKSFVWQGLDVSGALALVKCLEFEVRDLAAISIGIEAGIDSKAVLSKLIN